MEVRTVAPVKMSTAVGVKVKPMLQVEPVMMVAPQVVVAGSMVKWGSEVVIGMVRVRLSVPKLLTLWMRTERSGR